MKAIAYALALASLTLHGREITVINECNFPIFVAIAGDHSEGTDGLGDGGSAHWNLSVGWKRIGPFQRESVNGQYIRVQNKSTPLSAVSGGGVFAEQERVRSFCFHPNDAFTYKHFSTDNTAQNRAVDNLVSHCRKIGGRWGAFEKVLFNWGEYTVRAESCNRGMPDAARLRSRYQRDSGGDDNLGMTFYRVHPAATNWVQYNTKSGTFRTLREENSTSDYVQLNDTGYGVSYRLYQGTLKYLNNNTTQWRTMGAGRWYGDSDDRPTNGITSESGVATIEVPSSMKPDFLAPIDSRKTAVAKFPNRARLIGIDGEWTVDANIPMIKPLVGHTDPQLEQYSDYKLSKNHRFGILMVNTNNGWIPVEVGQVFEATEYSFRINDSDNTLGDNAGSVNLKFVNSN